jgi:uncharacterized protein with ATP-grasp and redox domains
MRHECYFCHIKTLSKLIEKYKPERKKADLFTNAISELLYKKKDLYNPLLATDIHRLAKKILGHSDLYEEEKVRANKILLGRYEYWEGMVKKSSNPLFKAAKLAVAGNIIDYGAHTVPEDIENQIRTLLYLDLEIDETDELIEKIGMAESILYLGDNAGEIVFDKLFIETMNHQNITYTVRGKAVINDVTFEDVKQTGLDKICKVISNGNDAPSTIMEYCSEEFKQEFNKADLVISKGQGNFEGLLNSEHDNLFFLLMAKCRPMAELLGVREGDMVASKLKVSVDAL